MQVKRGMIVAATAGMAVLFCMVVFRASAAFDVEITASVGDESAAVIQWVTPEGRVGAPGTNDDTTFFLTVRTAANNDNVVLFTQPTLLTTNDDGSYSVPIELTGIPSGTYDIGIKGSQHVTRVLQDVVLSGGGVQTLNFTQTDNSAPRGTQVLLAGDIDGAGTDPATLGSDSVNSVDLSLLIDDVDSDDPTGNALRANLNQDIVVNSIDFSMLIENLDAVGDI